MKHPQRVCNDTKLSDAADTLEGRDAVLSDLGRLERWTHANLTKFKKSKCKVLHLGQGSPNHRYRLGGEWLDSSTEEKYLEMLVDRRFSMSQ